MKLSSDISLLCLQFIFLVVVAETFEADRKIHMVLSYKQNNVDVLESHFWNISEPDHEHFRRFLSREELFELVSPLPKHRKKTTDWLLSAGAKDIRVNEDGHFVSFHFHESSHGTGMLEKLADFNEEVFSADHIKQHIPKEIARHFHHGWVRLREQSTHFFTKVSSQTISKPHCNSFTRDQDMISSLRYEYDPNYYSSAPIFCHADLMYKNDLTTGRPAVGLPYEFWDYDLKYFFEAEDILNILAVIPRCNDESFPTTVDSSSISCSSWSPSITSFEIEFEYTDTKEIKVGSPYMQCFNADVACGQEYDPFRPPPRDRVVCVLSVAKVMPQYLYQKVSSVTVRTLFSDSSKSPAMHLVHFGLIAKTASPQSLREMYNIPADLKGGKVVNRQLLSLPLPAYGFSYDSVQRYYDTFNESMNATDVKLTRSPYKKLKPSDSEGILDVNTITVIARGVETYFMPGDDLTVDLPNGEVTLLANSALQLSRLMDTDEYPYVISMSFGGPESICGLMPEILDSYKILFMKLGVLGTSVLVSSGDNGAQAWNKQCSTEGMVSSFPTSFPYVTSVGGTQQKKNYKTGKVEEVVCSFCEGGIITSGGGFSYLFQRPEYQEDVVSDYIKRYSNLSPYPPDEMYNKAGRGYPDISGLATNYLVIKNNVMGQVAGTSASAPLIAGMISLINEKLIQADMNPLGFLNPWLYKVSKRNKKAFKDILEGDNSCTESGSKTSSCSYGYPAKEGWDASTGLGVPDFGVLLQEALKSKNSGPYDKKQTCRSWNITSSDSGGNMTSPGVISKECVACSYPYHLQGNSCVATCGNGSYSAREKYGYQCKACDKNCSLCGYKGKCLRCDNKLYLKKGVCVDSCGSGFKTHGDETIGRKCIKICPLPNVSSISVGMDANCYNASVYSHCALHCNPGYSKMYGDTVLICLEEGQWDGEPLKCTEDFNLFRFCDEHKVPHISLSGYITDGSPNLPQHQRDCSLEFNLNSSSQFQLNIIRVPEKIFNGYMKIYDISHDNDDAVLLDYNAFSKKYEAISKTIVSFGNKIKVVYSPGQNTERSSGMVLHFNEYKAKDLLSLCACDHEENTLNGTLVSGIIVKDMKCQTILKNKPGQFVSFTIHELDLGEGFSRAELIIRDGNQTSDPQIPIGQFMPQTVVSTRGPMLISFSSKNMIEKSQHKHKGFVASFAPVDPQGVCPDMMIDLTTEEIIGDCYFKVGSICTVRCKMPAVAVQGKSSIRRECSILGIWIGEAHICTVNFTSVCESSHIRSSAGYITAGTASEERSAESLNCTQIISLPSQEDAMLINITRLQFEDEDALTIWDLNMGSILKIIDKRKYHDLPVTFVSSSNKIQISYTTGKHPGYGFTLNFRKYQQTGDWYALCNPTGIVNADKGFLTPYPLRDSGDYIINTNCSVTVSASSGRLVLSLLSFVTDEKHTLTVRDGEKNSELLGSFSGSAPVSSYVVGTGRSLLISFTAFDTVSVHPSIGNVRLSFTTTTSTKATCSILALAQNVQQIGNCFGEEGSECSYECQHGYDYVLGDTSRQCTPFGNWSGIDLICANNTTIYKLKDDLKIYSSESYLIIPGDDHHYRVNVYNPSGLEITLLKADFRAGDIFTFETGPNKLVISQDFPPPIVPYKFPHPSDSTVFISIYSVNTPRYIVHFNEPAASKVYPICDFSLVTADSGLVVAREDGDFGPIFPSRTTCVLVIKTASGGLFSLDVEIPNMQLGEQYLYVHDGSTSAAPLLARFSGDQNGTKQIVSTGQTLFFMFHVVIKSHCQFKVNFKSIPNKGVCKPLSSTANQNIKCPLQNKRCQFSCSSGFKPVQGNDILYCRGDSTWDGKQPVCVNSDLVFGLCSNRIIKAHEGFVRDRLDNSAHYIDDQTCTSFIHAPNPDKQLLLTFEKFRTERCKDILSIYDSAVSPRALLGSFSGSTLPRPILSTGSTLKLVFKTSPERNDIGFSFTFKQLNTTSGRKSPVEPSTGEPKHSLSSTMIVVIGVVCGCTALILLIVVIVCVKRRSSKSPEDLRAIVGLDNNQTAAI